MILFLFNIRVVNICYSESLILFLSGSYQHLKSRVCHCHILLFLNLSKCGLNIFKLPLYFPFCQISVLIYYFLNGHFHHDSQELLFLLQSSVFFIFIIICYMSSPFTLSQPAVSFN